MKKLDKLFFKNDDTQLDDHMRLYFLKVGLGLSFVSFIATLINNIAAFANIISFVFFFTMVILYIIEKKIKLGRINSLIFCIVSNFIIFPINFIYSGGYKSGSILVFLSGLLLIIILLSGWIKVVLFLTTLSLDITLVLYQILNPGVLPEVNDFAALVDKLGSFIILGILLYFILAVYLSKFRKTNIELENANKNLKNALGSEYVLKKIVKSIYENDDMDYIFDKLISVIGDELGADRTFVVLVRDKKLFATNEYCTVGVDSIKDKFQGLDLNSIKNWTKAFLRHESVIIKDIELIRHSSPDEYHLLKQKEINSLVIVPFFSSGLLKGYMEIDNPTPNKIYNIEYLLLSLSYFLTSKFELMQEKTILKKLSYTDKMTGLDNKNAYISEVMKMKSSEEISVGGIIFCDLNNLKITNDIFGHIMGDKLIISFAKSIQRIFKDCKSYRVGGDEFVIICEFATEKQFNNRLEEFKDYIEKDRNISAAVGGYWFTNPKIVDQALEYADQNMYLAKKEQKKIQGTEDS